MIKALIIDDEQHCIDRLSKLITENFHHTIQISGTFLTAADGITAIQVMEPDLVFLDIQIGNETGFDILKKLEEINFEVIFVTAYEKYAVQAFKFSAIDYLLKPVDLNDLQLAVAKLKEKLSKNELSARFDTLFHNLKNMHGIAKRICVPVLKGLVFLNVQDIIHCQANSNYTTIFLKDNQKIMVAKTLKEFEELLTDCNFYRIHNSHLINLAYVKNYNKGKGGYVIMDDNSELEVSTRKKENFLKRILEM